MTKEQMKKELRYLKVRGQQTIKLEYCRIVKAITKQVFRMALIAMESTLITKLRSQDLFYSKQRKLNDIYVREYLYQLKKDNS